MKAKIGRYAAENGNIAAVKKFSKELERNIPESSVRHFKKCYYEELKTQKEPDKVTEITNKTQGRPLTLGELDSECVSYIKKIRLAGGVVNRPVVTAAIKGILIAKKPSWLRENGGHIDLNRGMVESFIRRLGYVKRKGTKAARSKPAEFEKEKEKFHNAIKELVKKYDVPGTMIVNFDQTGTKIVPASEWTLEAEGAKQVNITFVHML